MMFCVRDHPYFDGDNPHLQTLRRMLLAHTILDPELGYAQKMIDIMSLIIITMAPLNVVLTCCQRLEFEL
jgi:hypothetical protein